jgi:hypothetical protein
VRFVPKGSNGVSATQLLTAASSASNIVTVIQTVHQMHDDPLVSVWLLNV